MIMMVLLFTLIIKVLPAHGKIENKTKKSTIRYKGKSKKQNKNPSPFLPLPLSSTFHIYKYI